MPQITHSKKSKISQLPKNVIETPNCVRYVLAMYRMYMLGETNISLML